MPSVERNDQPGGWHHVMNRGIAKRPVFESEAEFRFFLSRIAHVVRRGLLEVHAFTFLTTHFHLLVKSPKGRLSEAMREVEREFVLWFNRTRNRDGPLFRGRFTSRRIDSDAYWRAVLAYIDRNPVDAGLARRASDHEWSSAFHYARRGGPPWLTREVVESEVSRHFRMERYVASSYDDHLKSSDEAVSLIEHSCRTPAMLIADIDGLLGAARSSVADWLIDRARLADGMTVGSAVASAGSLIAIVERTDLRFEATSVDNSRPEWIRRGLVAGLLRHAAGLRTKQVAELLRCSRSTAGSRIASHVQRITSNPSYATLAATIVQSAMQATFSFRNGTGPGRQ